MSIVIAVNRIKVKKQFNVKKIEGKITKAMQDTVRDIKKDYNSITSGWNHTVKIDEAVNRRGSDAEVLVGTDDKILNFLDKGTSKRYALMYPGYKSKTRPGRIASSGGGGGVRYIGKKRPPFRKRKKWPLKGIKARNWTPILQRRATKNFQERIARLTKGNVIILE